MNLLTKPIEQPWAYATKQGFRPGIDATGNFFRYFITKAEAEKSIKWCEKRGKWHGPLEYRPGEAWHGGYL